MIKLLGSLMVFTGGGLVWWIQLKERRRKSAVLSDLALILRQMQEEIRMMRTPMPELFQKLENRCGQDVSGVLRTLSEAVKQGNEVKDIWREEICVLPMDKRTREVLCSLDFCGDEEKLCKDLSFAAYEMAKSVEELEDRRQEESKRTTALCFSCAALLVILLI